MKKGKACGPDSIPNEFLIEGGPELHEILLQIFDIFLQIEDTPESLCEETSQLIHKAGSKMELDN